MGGWPEGGVGPQKSQQFSTPLGKRRGERGGRDARGAPSARQNRQRCSSRATRSQTPNLLIGGRSDTAAAARRTHAALALKSPEGTRRWRQTAGRGQRGPAAAPAPPPPPWPPPPREPIRRRRPQAARRTATRLPGLCARTRKGWGRLESKHRAGWGSQVMFAAAGVGGTLRFSTLPERVGLFHPGWR